MRTTEIEIKDHKNYNIDDAIDELGMTYEDGLKVFKYGEFLNATIIVDEKLNIIGGKIHQCG